VLAGGMLLRFALVWQPIDWLDRYLLVDDSYIAFNVSRNLGLGRGPLGDSLHLTSGYQPLYVWLMAPVFRACGTDRVVPIHLALSFLAVCNVATGALLSRLLAKAAGPLAGMLGLALWMFSPQVLQIGLNGLETSLSSFLLVACVTLASRMHETRSTPRLVFGFGCLVGLATLARIDNALLLLSLGTVLAWQAARESRLVACLATGGSGLACLVAPWLAINDALSGSPLPESGAGTRFQTFLNGDGSVMSNSAWLQKNVAYALSSSMVLGFLLSLLVLATLWAIPTTRQRLGRPAAPLLWLALHATLLLLFYCGLVGAYWYFYRYFYPVRLALVGLVAVGVSLAGAALARRLRAQWLPASLGALVVVGVVALELPRTLAPHLGGYREIGLWANETLPAGTLVAAAQAGSLAYHGDRLRVVNIDGKINREALTALQERDMSGYLRRQGVRYVLDWEWNVRKLVIGRSLPGTSDMVVKQRINTVANGEWLLYELR
jgi:4-amino-4-deoxy-L-arabinose transferase-like glycosyltransferase